MPTLMAHPRWQNPREATAGGHDQTPRYWKLQLPVGHVGLAEARQGGHRGRNTRNAPPVKASGGCPRTPDCSHQAPTTVGSFHSTCKVTWCFPPPILGEESHTCICTKVPGCRGLLSCMYSGTTKKATTLGSSSHPTSSTRSLTAASLSSSPHHALLTATTSWPKEPSFSKTRRPWNRRATVQGSGKTREDE